MFSVEFDPQGHHGPAEGGASAGRDGGEVPRDGRPHQVHDGVDAVDETLGRLTAQGSYSIEKF